MPPHTPPNPDPALLNRLIPMLAEPAYSELDLCDSLGLTLPELLALIESDACQRALAIWQRIRETREPLINAELARAAKARLATVADLPPTSAAAARESRLAAQALTPPSPACGGGGRRSRSEGDHNQRRPRAAGCSLRG